VVRADEAASWDDLHERFEVKRIDHQETYSLDSACTDMAEEYFSCLRRAGTGTRHHTAGSYLPRYAQGGVWTGEGEEWAMRVLIPALSVLGILICADTAKSDPSTTNRDLSASVDPATFTDEATQETEDQIGLDKGKRRDVQRRLTGLGFDTKGSGKFDESTRAVIARWQGARGYPKTGFLNTLQHDALLADSVSAAHASSSGSEKFDDDNPPRRRDGGGAHHHRSGGGPGGLIGGMMGGLFGRR
jgi:ISXO2-like transposase domain/Putative peptidoglycan binding domain